MLSYVCTLSFMYDFTSRFHAKVVLKRLPPLFSCPGFFLRWTLSQLSLSNSLGPWKSPDIPRCPISLDIWGPKNDAGWRFWTASPMRLTSLRFPNWRPTELMMFPTLVHSVTGVSKGHPLFRKRCQNMKNHGKIHQKDGISKRNLSSLVFCEGFVEF